MVWRCSYRYRQLPDTDNYPQIQTLPNMGAADRGRHLAQLQRRLEDRTWPQVLEGATTTRGRSSVPVSEWVSEYRIVSYRSRLTSVPDVWQSLAVRMLTFRMCLHFLFLSCKLCSCINLIICCVCSNVVMLEISEHFIFLSCLLEMSSLLER